MSIHQHKDGRYYVAYREPGNPSVKKKYFGRGAQGKQLALAWELERMKSPETATKTPARELTFSELAEKYLALHPLAESTRIPLVYNLNSNVLPLFGDTLVSALSQASQNALDSRLAQPRPKTGKPASVATRNRYKAMCRAICQWGYDQGLTASNPFGRVKLDRKRRAGPPI